jgi:hypothetical protein
MEPREEVAQVQVLQVVMEEQTVLVVMEAQVPHMLLQVSVQHMQAAAAAEMNTHLQLPLDPVVAGVEEMEARVSVIREKTVEMPQAMVAVVAVAVHSADRVVPDQQAWWCFDIREVRLDPLEVPWLPERLPPPDTPCIPSHPAELSTFLL